jgi:CDP-2,3-bis-(O-geranylgeranyl)-sn-glycerol synthase
MAPTFFSKYINFPINKKLFGKNKTYKGFLLGIISAIIIVYLQKLLNLNFSLIEYTNPLLLGFLLGFGALFGDLVESFFKRRLKIKEGTPWIIFDQLDWIIGSIIFINFYIKTSLTIIITSIVLFGLLHPVINYLGYLLKLKKNKF